MDVQDFIPGEGDNNRLCAASEVCQQPIEGKEAGTEAARAGGGEKCGGGRASHGESSAEDCCTRWRCRLQRQRLGRRLPLPLLLLLAAAATFMLCPPVHALVTSARETQALLEVGVVLGGRVVAQWPVDFTSVQTSSDWSYSVNPCGDAGDGSKAWVGVQCKYEYDGPSGAPPSSSNEAARPEPVYATITGLLLQGSDAAGWLPGALFDLTSLRRLDLSLNPQLSGTIPTQLGRLTDLQLLDLHECGFSGSLPSAAFATLPVLEQLMLGSNDFTGPLPSTLSASPRLYYLDVMGNRLSGTVPPQLSACTALGHLHLSYNQFSSYPAGWLTGLSNLAHLLLDNNALVQPLPTEVSLLPKLIILHLSYNRFWGFNVSGLVRPYSAGSGAWEDLSKNSMFMEASSSGSDAASGTTSTITSSSTATSTSTTAAAAAASRPSGLRGTLQRKRRQAKSVMEEVDDSRGHGADSYGQHVGLVDLTARNCLVSQGVQLPTALLRSPAAGQLLVLDLGGNGIEGQLTAADLTGLTQLRTLRMDRNRISGSLPHAMSALTSLRTLNLSHNLLSGVVPDLSNVPSPLTADLSNNGIADASVRNFAIADLQLSLQNTTACTFDEPAPNGTTSAASATSTDLMKSICQPGPASTVMYMAAPVCPDATAVTCPPSSLQGGVFEMDPGPFRVSSTCRCTSPLLLELRLTAPQFSSYDKEIAKKFEHTVHHNLHTAVSNLAQEQVWLKLVHESFLGSMTHKAMLGFFPPVNSSDFALDKRSVDTIKVLFNKREQSKYMLGKFGPYAVLGFSGPAETDSATSKEPISVGAIVGIVLAAAVATGFVLTLVFVFIWRKRERQYDRWTQEDYNALEGLNIQGVERYSLKSIKEATDDFRLLIGKGGFGHVYRGDLPSGETVAVKQATLGGQKRGVDFCNEIELLSRVRHRNCVQLKGYCHEAGEQLLVFEYAERGTLFDVLHKNQGGGEGPGGGGGGGGGSDGEAWVPGAAAAVADHALSWTTRLRLAVGAAHGLAYLHFGIQPPIIHRDVKSANILIDSKWRAKVADFGLSKLVPEDHPEGGELDTGVKGTLGYLDPAYAMTCQLSDKSDVYSFGVVLLEIATGLRVVNNERHIRDFVLDRVEQEGEMSVADPRMRLAASHNGSLPSTDLSSLTDASTATSSSRGNSVGASMDMTSHSSFKQMLNLAFWCTQYEPDSRPDMQLVVKILDECLEMCGDAPAAAVDGDDDDDDDDDDDHHHHHHHHLHPYHYDDTAAAAAAASSSAAAAAAAARAAAAVAPGSSYTIPGPPPTSTSANLSADKGDSFPPLKVGGSSGSGVAVGRVVHRCRGSSPIPSPGSWREASLNVEGWAGTAAGGRVELLGRNMILSALPFSGSARHGSSHDKPSESWIPTAEGNSDIIPR